VNSSEAQAISATEHGSGPKLGPKLGFVVGSFEMEGGVLGTCEGPKDGSSLGATDGLEDGPAVGSKLKDGSTE